MSYNHNRYETRSIEYELVLSNEQQELIKYYKSSCRIIYNYLCSFTDKRYVKFIKDIFYREKHRNRLIDLNELIKLVLRIRVNNRELIDTPITVARGIAYLFFCDYLKYFKMFNVKPRLSKKDLESHKPHCFNVEDNIPVTFQSTIKFIDNDTIEFGIGRTKDENDKCVNNRIRVKTRSLINTDLNGFEIRSISFLEKNNTWVAKIYFRREKTKNLKNNGVCESLVFDRKNLCFISSTGKKLYVLKNSGKYIRLTESLIFDDLDKDSKRELTDKIKENILKDISKVTKNLVNLYDRIYILNELESICLNNESAIDILSKYVLDIFYTDLKEKYLKYSESDDRYVKSIDLGNMAYTCAACGNDDINNIMHSKSILAFTGTDKLHCTRCNSVIDLYKNTAINLLRKGKEEDGG